MVSSLMNLRHVSIKITIMKTSVALITFNSEKFLRPQLDTILENLGPEDEVIISDDGSTDATAAILKSYQEKDPRIQCFSIAHSGCNKNYENAISHCSGDVIFLSDDDNVWKANKVSEVVKVFKENPSVSMVMHDCVVTDEALNPILPSLFDNRKAKPGLFRNIMKCSYGGSLIAFRKELVKKILPFPRYMPVFYDEWIGLQASKHGKVVFLHETLSFWRRHQGSASSGYLSTNGKATAKKKAALRGSLKRFWQRIWTRTVKIWWALFF
jgi:glycosyltransferase involved in cell wall biosynthesis